MIRGRQPDHLHPFPSEMAFAIWSTVPIAGVILFILRFYRRHVSFSLRSRGLSLPPGPPGLPVIGNLREVQAEFPWKVYHDLGKTYGMASNTHQRIMSFRRLTQVPLLAGEIVYLNVVGQSLLVLNDFKTAVELLDRRSAVYSSRQISNMVTL